MGLLKLLPACLGERGWAGGSALHTLPHLDPRAPDGRGHL